MVNMLLRSQLNVCSIKTTKSGHRDRFEMDILQRLNKIRQTKNRLRAANVDSHGSLTSGQAAKVQENRDLNKMYKAYTGDKTGGGGDGTDEEEDIEDEEAKDFHDRTVNQKYDIKK